MKKAILILLIFLVLFGCFEEPPLPEPEPEPEPKPEPLPLDINVIPADVVVSNYGDFIPTYAMPSPRRDHAMALLHDGRVLITGGFWASALFGQHTIMGAEIFTPPEENEYSGEMQIAGKMNYVRRYPSATTLQDGRVLVVGGIGETNTLASAEIFDPNDGNGLFELVKEECNLVEARRAHTATLLNNERVLIAGGIPDKHSTNTIELFDPETGCFSQAGEMWDERARHTATLLDDGRVLIVGGGDKPNQRGELFDPETNELSLTRGEMPFNIYGHSAIKLENGKVLIAGGRHRPSGYLEKGLIFDQETETFSETRGSINVQRWNANAHLLKDGTVLIIGGLGSDGTILKSAEIFNPETGQFTQIFAKMTWAVAYFDSVALDDGRVFIAGGCRDGCAMTQLFDTQLGGKIWFNVSGGKEPYSYELLEGEGNFIEYGELVIPSKEQKITVRITDSLGNTKKKSVNVEFGD